MSVTGTCLCGQVRATLASDPVAVAVCHCTHCQKTAGSAFSVVLLVPAPAVQLEGPVTNFGDQSNSGNSVNRSFCSRCGTPVETSSDGTRAQGIRIIKAGLFAEAQEFKPNIEIFCDRRRGWLPAVQGTAVFGGMPPG
jgi:hypothetical protein